jgi:hypothetical protein
MKKLTVLAVFLTLALAAGTATAKGKPERSGSHGGRTTESRSDVLVDVAFSEVERHLIEDFFGRKAVYPSSGGGGGGGGLPPGLAKRDQLPPGLAKRDQLPPGLAKRALPDDLSRRLGAPRAGTERVIVGNDVLLVQAATGLVLDILYNVVTQK